MKRLFAIIVLAVLVTACGASDHTVEAAKPRLHNSWPKKHRWHKKLHIWKFTFQMPERGGAKKVKMRS